MPVPDFTTQVTNLRSSGRREDGGIQTAFEQVKRILDKLESRLTALEDFQLSVTRLLQSAGVQVKSFYLTADLSLPFPEEAAGTLIFYIFLQDSTGGRTVALPSGFVGFYPDQISLDADRLSTLIAFKSYQDQVVPAAFGIEGVITT